LHCYGQIILQLGNFLRRGSPRRLARSTSAAKELEHMRQRLTWRDVVGDGPAGIPPCSATAPGTTASFSRTATSTPARPPARGSPSPTMPCPRARLTSGATAPGTPAPSPGGAAPATAGRTLRGTQWHRLEPEVLRI